MPPRFQLGLLLTVGGGGLLLFGLVLAALDFYAMTWTQTTARILSLEKLDATDTEKEEGAANRYAVRYEYDVGGKTYTSDRWTTGSKVSKKTEDELELLTSGSDSTADVYYCPLRPRAAVLERDFRFWVPFLCVVGMIALRAGLRMMR